ncbi:MAG: hypothetical protein PHI63_00045 [Patescibacteria group bacterium]|nr:hypothetical protein [Patescibacteria group bacterium]
MEPKRLRQLQQQSGVDSELLKIYRDYNGQVPDISRLQIHRTNWTARILGWALALGVVGGLGWWAWASFIGGNGTAASSLRVAVTAPPELASGEAVTYAISYENVDRVALQGVELNVRYPEGFTFVSAEPTPSNAYHNTWQLGQLLSGRSGQVRITGKVVGNIGSIVTVTGTATYRPQNFNESFKAKNDFTSSSQITTSLLTLEIAGPGQAVADREVTYTVNYVNASDNPLSDVLIVATYPAGFTFRKATPGIKPPSITVAYPSNVGGKPPDATWVIPTIEPKAKGQIVLVGGFPTAQQVNGNGGRELVVRGGFVDETGTFSLQQEQRFTTALLQPNLQLSLIINGQTTDKPVNFGDTLDFRVVYKNLGKEKLQDVRITVEIASKLIDWNTLTDKNLGRVSGNSIQWDQLGIAGLAEIPPLGEGTIDFSVQLKPQQSVEAGVENFSTVSTAKAAIASVDNLASDQVVAATPITNTVNTSLTLKAQGRYFNDDNLAVGSGPLPPVVGEKTSFRIYWSLQNSLHEAKRVTVTTKLSADVVWENKQIASTGQLIYNPDDRTVTWAITSMPTKASEEDYNAWFDISVTPAQDEVGKLLLLTSETNLAATDAVTNAPIDGMVRSITSNLEDDPSVAGRGLVVELGQ